MTSPRQRNSHSRASGDGSVGTFEPGLFTDEYCERLYRLIDRSPTVPERERPRSCRATRFCLGAVAVRRSIKR
jgi:hypothetical protein